MLENLVYRASRLSLSTKVGANSGKGRTSSRQGSSVDSSRSRRASSITDKGSDTSGVLRSDDNFSSISYSFEHSEPEHIAAAPRPTQPSSSRNEPGSPMVTFGADSPGIQTLAELKKEAVHDRQQKTRNEKGRYVASSKSTARAKRGVSRSCKIMKEAYFKGLNGHELSSQDQSTPYGTNINFIVRFARQIYPYIQKGLEKFSDIIRQRNIYARINVGDMNIFTKLIQ